MSNKQIRESKRKGWEAYEQKYGQKEDRSMQAQLYKPIELEGYIHNDIELGRDDHGYLLKCPNGKHRLSPMEFRLLGVLMANAGRVVPREFLLSKVWGYQWFGDSVTVEVHICWLRRKLGDTPKKSRYIRTVRGIGYKFQLL